MRFTPSSAGEKLRICGYFPLQVLLPSDLLEVRP